jgi:hypothetical protein
MYKEINFSFSYPPGSGSIISLNPDPQPLLFLLADGSEFIDDKSEMNFTKLSNSTSSI